MKTTQERNGRWSAEIPGFARSYGASREDAVAGVTVAGLRIVTDRIELLHREIIAGIAYNPERFAPVESLVEELLAALARLEVPNAETVASIEAGRRGEVFKAANVKEFLVALNEDDEND